MTGLTIAASGAQLPGWLGVVLLMIIALGVLRTLWRIFQTQGAWWVFHGMGSMSFVGAGAVFLLASNMPAAMALVTLGWVLVIVGEVARKRTGPEG